MSRLLSGLCFPERKLYTVRKFILAYIRGEITFDLVIKPETYKRRLEMDGKPVDEAQAFDETQKLFFQIPNTMLTSKDRRKEKVY